MWFDDMDQKGRGICRPAQGPLGRSLRGLRHELWLSQQQLADIAGVSQTTVSKIELGSPSWSLFCQLVEAVGGRPVVSIERIPTTGEITRALENGEDPYPPGWAPRREQEFIDWW